MYDFIGDIHGKADSLARLLENLGYEQKEGCYRHPEGRKAVFLGDFIDKGNVREVLNIVKPMVDKGAAKAILSDHEFNFLCFMSNNKFSKLRSERGMSEVSDAIDQLSKEEIDEYVNWLQFIPAWHEQKEFRAVSGCWSHEAIETLGKYFPDALIKLDVLNEHYRPGTELYGAIETLLEGPQASLPEKEGVAKKSAKIAWWNREKPVAEEGLEGKYSRDEVPYGEFYDPNDKPVFFGHYRLKARKPFVTGPNAQCLDFADGECVVAYRFDGEKEIKNEKLFSMR